MQFLDLDSPKLKSKVVILPLPLEKTTSYMKGTANGPRAIVEASTQVELFDAELGQDPSSVGIYTDWELGHPSWNSEAMEDILDQIRQKVRELLKQERFVLALGGEHTITVGLIDPFLEKWGNSLTVIQIDAHADLKDQYQGNPYSHACVMRRLVGRVPIISAGIRSVDEEEFRIGKTESVQTFYAHEIRENPNWIADLISYIQTEHVYLTVDVDGLDPSIIPSVGTPEPGGLTWEETLRLIRAITENRKIVGADVNELCPNPNNRYADFATAKLCYKIIGYALT